MAVARYKYLVYVAEVVAVLIIAYAIGGILFGPWLSYISPSTPNRTISMLSSSTFPPLTTSLYAWVRFKNTRSSINELNTVTYIYIGTALSVAISLVSFYVLGNRVIAINEIWSMGGGYFIFSVFLLTIFGPTIEEVLFRGYLYELLAKLLSPASSLIIVSIIFYFIHAIIGGFNLGTLFTLFYSVAFTFVYINGGLVASIVSHVSANTLLFIVCSYW